MNNSVPFQQELEAVITDLAIVPEMGPSRLDYAVEKEEFIAEDNNYQLIG